MRRLFGNRATIAIVVFSLAGVWPMTGAAQSRVETRVGIEGGLAQSRLRRTVWGPAGPPRESDMSAFLLLPAARISVLWSFVPMVDLLAIGGYAESGGRLEAEEIRHADGRRGPGSLTYRLRSAELCMFGLYAFGSLRAGAGAKVERLIAAQEVYQIDFLSEGERSTFRSDATERFRPWHASVGGRLEWMAGPVVFWTEAWLGLTNLDPEGDTVRADQLGLGIGFRL